LRWEEEEERKGNWEYKDSKRNTSGKNFEISSFPHLLDFAKF